MLLIEVVYVAVVILLSVYGLHSLSLTVLAIRKKTKPVENPDNPAEWPAVTVQLPIYNERYVVKRLLDAVSSLSYPHQKLQIQVLDDSNDATSEIIASLVLHYQTEGINIVHIQRSGRAGYKSGALAWGLNSASGEYIAIFDADFVPAPDTLQRMIPYLASDPDLGCVQARWGHINPDISWLTRAQSAGIDGHFVVEQTARSTSGLMLNFNGTAGIWRRACLEDSAGWSSDTLTEDLDLSYRAQLRGWRIRYLPDVIVPGELPATVSAYKRQQFRWAKGSIQTAKKMLPQLWLSRLNLKIKIGATLHLTSYLVHPLILLNLILALPISFSQSPLLKLVPFIAVAGLGTGFMYWIAMQADSKNPLQRIFYMIALLILGLGLSVNNTRAVFEALVGIKSAFLRTPKYNLQNNTKRLQGSAYKIPNEPTLWIETVLALYALSIGMYTIHLGNWRLVIWIMVYGLGFTYIAGLVYINSFQAYYESKNQTQNTPPILSVQSFPIHGEHPLPKDTLVQLDDITN
jgi:cellulose synthase/poly-beta-1,6-N-acetylglucosamine synthase-like glycosyltransferase